jgi:hypothetical protein
VRREPTKRRAELRPGIEIEAWRRVSGWGEVALGLAVIAVAVLTALGVVHLIHLLGGR